MHMVLPVSTPKPALGRCQPSEVSKENLGRVGKAERGVGKVGHGQTVDRLARGGEGTNLADIG